MSARPFEAQISRRTRTGPTHRGGAVLPNLSHSTSYSLTDGDGVPLAVAVSGATTHDMRLVEATLQSFAIRRPRPKRGGPKQHFCEDKGYDYADTRDRVRRWGYT